VGQRVPKVGDYGFEIRMTLVDEDGTAVDISSATTRQILIEDPSGTVTTKTASFVTDGTDGLISWTVTDGFLATAGRYALEANVTDGSAFQYRSQTAILEVDGVIA
jgi:hypothetical protein